MASESGGRADKVGNEFERLWTVYQLIELGIEKSLSLSIEQRGADEIGVEFWVTRHDGTREAHQCKRENGAKGKWSISDLKTEGVLEKAKYQLERDPKNRFVFVSGDKAPILEDFYERAESSQSSKDFLLSIGDASKNHRDDLLTLCSIWSYDLSWWKALIEPHNKKHNRGQKSRQLVQAAFEHKLEQEIDSNDSDGLCRVIDNLRRFNSMVINKNRIRIEVEGLAQRWWTGDPNAVVARLKDLADESIGKTLRAVEVRTKLNPFHRSQDLAKDDRVLPAINSIQARFERLYRPTLIMNSKIGRSETDDITECLRNDNSERILLIHGPAGSGKSGVLYELINWLRSNDFQFLPLRLDHDDPQSSPLRFGHSLELPASPVHCLSAVSAGGNCILILDQVDAIRWTASHSSLAWDTCERMIEEALTNDKMRVLMACRSFDLEDNPHFRSISQREGVKKIQVNPLSDSQVDKITSNLGVNLTEFNERQKEILRSPFGLHLWYELSRTKQINSAFSSIAGLLRSYWGITWHGMQSSGLTDGNRVIDILVDYMDAGTRLTAPLSIICRYQKEIKALVSRGLLVVEEADKIAFTHQSHLDYLVALRNITEVHTQSKSILEWIENSDQSLFRRDQLRLTLLLLRDDDPSYFDLAIRGILKSTKVRFHLKHLILQVLGEVVNPRHQEIGLIIELLHSDSFIDHVLNLVLLRREAWFDTLDQDGYIKEWINSGNDQLQELTVRIVNRFVLSRGTSVERIIEKNQDSQCAKSIESQLWRFSPGELSQGLYLHYLEKVRAGELIYFEHLNWPKLASTTPDRCIELFEAFIDVYQVKGAIQSMYDLFGDRGNRKSSKEVFLSLIKVYCIDPLNSWDRLVRIFDKSLNTYQHLRHSNRRIRQGSPYYERSSSLRRCLAILVRLLSGVGKASVKTYPLEMKTRLDFMRSRNIKICHRIVLNSLMYAPDDWANDMIRWIATDSVTFECGPVRSNDRTRPSAKIIARYARLCDATILVLLQSSIRLYRPEHEYKEFLDRHNRLMGISFSTYSFDVLTWNNLGLSQYRLLSAIPRHLLLDEFMGLHGVLSRKFEKRLRSEISIPKGVFHIVSPIPEDRIPFLSDQMWLRIISGRSPQSRSQWKRMGTGRIAESNPSTLSSSLFTAARLAPYRFAVLAMSIPLDANPLYINRLLEGITDPNPPENADSDWETADTLQIERIYNRFEFLFRDREFSLTFIRSIRNRIDDHWQVATISRLVGLAITHEDPDPVKPPCVSLVPRPGQEDSDHTRELDIQSINSVRGQASLTLASLISRSPEYLTIVRPAIDALARDPHPAVRYAAFSLATALLDIDSERSIQHVQLACSDINDIVLSSRHLNLFLSYSILEHHNSLESLIDRMTRSSVLLVSKSGGGWTALVRATRGTWVNRYELCKKGQPHLRCGVAQGLAAVISDAPEAEECVLDLISFFDDDDKQVRYEASTFFNREDALKLNISVVLSEFFVASLSFLENAHAFLDRLDRFSGNITPFATVLFQATSRIASTLAHESRDFSSHHILDVDLLVKLLLKVYDHSDGRSLIRQQCLDSWDLFLQERLGYRVFDIIDS
jgi:hypothetical protein